MEDADAPAYRYGLVGEMSLDKTYYEVYLKTIRFTIAYAVGGENAHETEGMMHHPYQIHLRWLDNRDVGFHPGEVLQNTMYLANGLITNGTDRSYDKVNYSTFCQADNVYIAREPSILNNEHEKKGYYADDIKWLHYNMTRDALIKQGSTNYLSFELFFTNLNGERLYTYIPNVEIELDLY